MNPPVVKKEEQSASAVAIVRPTGKKVSVTLRFDEAVMRDIKSFANAIDQKVPDVIALCLATGVDALTGDTLKPFAKISLPAIWEFIARNKSYAETVKKLHSERLKELRDKIEVKEDEES